MTPDTCPNCGADVPHGARACPECGADEKTGWSEEAYASSLGLPDNCSSMTNLSSGSLAKRSMRLPYGIKWFWWAWWRLSLSWSSWVWSCSNGFGKWRLIKILARFPSGLDALESGWLFILAPCRRLAAISWPGPEWHFCRETNFAAAWPTEGPPVRWKKEVGQGFSGPVVVRGKLILFQRKNDQEIVDCLDAKTGADVWHFAIRPHTRNDFGFDEGPRATPSIAGRGVCI